MSRISVTLKPLLKLCFTVSALVSSVFGAGGVNVVTGDFQALTLTTNSRIVGIDQSNDILTSDDDGESFTLRLNIEDLFTASDTLVAINSVGATVVAVGGDALIARSADSASNWAASAAPVLAGTLNGVAGRTDGSNPNEWIAVGEDGFDSFIYRSQDDGITWSVVAVGNTFQNILLEDVIWTGSRWVACGRDPFFNDGVVFNSLDGVSWTTSTVPAGSAPLLSLDHDGNDVVVAVGEQGAILRSTDDGLNFLQVANGLLSEDLGSVAAGASSDVFFVGGSDGVVIELQGASASFINEPAVNTGTVEDIVLVNGSPAIGGDFGGVTVRTIPFAATIAITPSGFQITVSQTLTNRSYFLESTSDLLTEFTEVTGTTRIGTGGELVYNVPNIGSMFFFRVVEF